MIEILISVESMMKAYIIACSSRKKKVKWKCWKKQDLQKYAIVEVESKLKCYMILNKYYGA